MKRCLSLLILSLTCLTSCANVKSLEAIYISKNIEPVKNLINVNANTLSLMIENGESFPLLVGSNTCSLCEKAKELVNNYINKTSYTIYYYEYDAYSYSFLTSAYPHIFVEGTVRPYLYTIQDRNSHLYLDASDVTNYNALRPTLNLNLKDSDIYSCFSFNTYLNNFKDNYIFYSVNNFDRDLSYSLFRNFYSSKKKLIYINKNTISENEVNLFTSHLNIKEGESILIKPSGERLIISSTTSYSDLISFLNFSKNS